MNEIKLEIPVPVGEWKPLLWKLSPTFLRGIFSFENYRGVVKFFIHLQRKLNSRQSSEKPAGSPQKDTVLFMEHRFFHDVWLMLLKSVLLMGQWCPQCWVLQDCTSEPGEVRPKWISHVAQFSDFSSIWSKKRWRDGRIDDPSLSCP